MCVRGLGAEKFNISIYIHIIEIASGVDFKFVVQMCR